MPSSRRSYSITDKLSILDEYEPGIQGRDFHALGRRHGVSASTIRGWWSKRAELTAASRDRRVATRIARRLNGGGRRSDYSELEERLHECLPTGKAKDYGFKTRTSDCKLPTSTVSFTAMVPSASRPLQTDWCASKRAETWCRVDRQRHGRYRRTHLPFASASSSKPSS
ncbi:hypothetical protein PR001_g10129 [Phytophthora rubi]|uniref:Uncharacterized protein n=1 Tax=Phytophthora rubi TaxID=129364 RepID=A0A6A3MXI3_9STRA|nr:hypothetical protein PR001_g10129 [Phytophthora rubi]